MLNPAEWCTAEELAEIHARSDAMHHQADVYERELLVRLEHLKDLAHTEEGIDMLITVASVIALELLRCAALGVPGPSWAQALEERGALSQRTIRGIMNEFKKEASSG